MLALAKIMTAAPWWRGPTTVPNVQEAAEAAEALGIAEVADPGPSCVPRDGSVRRAALRFQHLLPTDSSAASFDAWLAATAVAVPADEMADLYADVCLLAGWPLCDVPAAEDVGDVPAPAPGPEHKACVSELLKLTSQDAAHRFRDWMFECRRDGVYTSDEVSAHYLEHCQAEGLLPHPENEMRQCLQRLGGVAKSQVDINQKTNPGGQRKRCVRWTFKTPKSFLETVPWTELPDRRQAA